MRVVIDEAAYGDLVDIHAWIARDRPTAAASVIERILSAAEHLGHHPGIGHQGPEPGTYEWVVRGLPYIIVFEHNPNREEIVVIGVFHGAREHRRPLR